VVGVGESQAQGVGVERGVKRSEGAFSPTPVFYRYTIYRGYVMRETFEKTQEGLELKFTEIKKYEHIDIERYHDGIVNRVDVIIDSLLHSHRADEVEIYYELDDRCECTCDRSW
jgi:hypothetical protein